MLPKSLTLLTSVLAGMALAGSPITAYAGGMSHIGTWGGGHGGVPRVGTLNCHPGGGPIVPRSISTTINNTLNVYKPVTSIKNVNVNNNININKNIDIYKPVTNIKNINVSKDVNISKNIDNSKSININKNIDNSKNININKNIVINKGGGEAEAAAMANAVAAAMASSSSSAVINFNGGNGSQSFASAFGYSGSGAFVGGGSYIAETPGPSVGDIGSINVEAPAPACTFQEATVIKAIHAVCVSADHHEFPASHMVPDTWIDSAYEGEVARCLPGSHLRITVGSVFQSSEGMASSWTNAQALECGPHEAVRHYKGGMLKCAPAVAVPDCTERTNLRKYGTGDMFFTYRAKVCMETHQEYSENLSRMSVSRENEPRGY